MKYLVSKFPVTVNSTTAAESFELAKFKFDNPINEMEITCNELSLICVKYFIAQNVLCLYKKSSGDQLKTPF